MTLHLKEMSKKQLEYGKSIGALSDQLISLFDSSFLIPKLNWRRVAQHLKRIQDESETEFNIPLKILLESKERICPKMMTLYRHLESDIVKKCDETLSSPTSAIVETELLYAESQLEETFRLGSLSWVDDQIKRQEFILSQLQEVKALLTKV